MTGKMLNIKDAYADPRFNQNFDKKTGYKTKSLLTVPIKDTFGRTTGVMQAVNKYN